MWSAVTKFLGLSPDSEDDDDCVDDSKVKQSVNTDQVAKDEISEQIEEKEFDGVVTSLHTAYGLINNEIFFTEECICDGSMPNVGDPVHVVTWRKGSVGGWRAKRVFVNLAKGEFGGGDADTIEDETESYSADFKNDSNRTAANRTLRIAKHTTEMLLQQLLLDKGNVKITAAVDFGRLLLGDSASLPLSIINEGLEVQKLNSCEFLALVQSSQFEVGAVLLDSVDLAQSSRKAQQALPLTLEPGKSASVTIFCTARYLGSEKQTVVFKFDGFEIGRLVTVSVSDSAMLELQPSRPYQRTKTVDRYNSAQSNNTWTIPGQRPVSSMSSIRLPSRLPQYPVPEKLRKCILEKKDVTLVAPLLTKVLCPRNYASRFSTLLHLEEIQQDIEIHEYDLENVTLRRVGEFLALMVPGLAEGRPSLLIGDSVILSNTNNSQFAPSYQGYIHEILKEEILLKFSDDFHSTYVDQQYNVQFTYNRNTLRRAHMAVEFAQKLPHEVTFATKVSPKPLQTLNQSTEVAEVVKVTTTSTGVGVRRCPLGSGSSNAKSTGVNTIRLFNKLLNERQQAAVSRVLAGQCRPSPYVIFGPPGTGKTVTVVESILQVFHHVSNSRILACTPSNSAADLLTERLHDSSVGLQNMVRLNAFRRSDESIPDCIRPFCVDGEDLKTVAAKRIVICTCTTAGMFYGIGLSASNFTHVFVDEAGQATEPECMIPVGLVAAGNGQVVLAGDPMQLGPVLRSSFSKEYGLQLSFLERIMALEIYQRNEMMFANHGSYDPMLVTKLVENYRSHPALIQLSSEIFYNNELVVSAENALVECLCPWDKLPNHNFPVLFHGIRGEDLREGNSPSWFNAQEAIQVMKYLQSIVNNDFYQLTFDDIGIITPYRKQVEKIRLLIDRLGMDKVKVGSVEEFQGQERLAMIISTVRSQDSLVSVDLRYTLGFLSNPKRFNVAITRAHALLIIVGNPHVLAQDIYWYSLIKYCVVNGAYIGCDPPDLGLMSDPPGMECRAITSSATQTLGSVLLTVPTEAGDSAGSVKNCEQPKTDAKNVMSVADQLSEISLLDIKGSETTSEPPPIVVCSSMQEIKSESHPTDVDTPPAEVCLTTSSESHPTEMELHSINSCLTLPVETLPLDIEPQLAQGKPHSAKVDSAMPSEVELLHTEVELLPTQRQQHSIEGESFPIDTILSEVHQNDASSTIKDLQSEKPGSILLQVTDDFASGSNCNNSNSQMDDEDTSVHEDDKSSSCSKDADCCIALNKPAVSIGSKKSRDVDSSFDLVPSPVVNAKPLPCATLSNRYLQRLEQAEGINKDSQPISRSSSRLSRTSAPGGHSVDSAMPSSQARPYQSSGLASNECPDLEKKIIRQMEYYFGDFNLMTDAFLAEQMKKDENGWIPLSVIVTFNRMKLLSTDFQMIVSALRKATAGLIEVSEDELHVRRSVNKPAVTNLVDWKTDLKTRSVVIEKYPMSETFDQMQEYFEKFGGIAHIERRIPKFATYRGNSGRIEWIDLIIFHSPASAANLLKLRLTTLKNMGIRASFSNPFVDDCIGYFFAKKVECLPRSELKPVKWSSNEPRSFNPRTRRNTDDGQKMNSAPLQIVEDTWGKEEEPGTEKPSAGNARDLEQNSAELTDSATRPDYGGAATDVNGCTMSFSSVPSSGQFGGFEKSVRNLPEQERSVPEQASYNSNDVTHIKDQTSQLESSVGEVCSPSQLLFNPDQYCRSRGRGFLLASQESRSPGINHSALTISSDVTYPLDDLGANMAVGLPVQSSFESPSTSYQCFNETAFCQRSCFEQLDDDIIIESCTEELIEDDAVAPGES